MSDCLRIMVIGAHPDDCEVRAGGLAALYVAAGHQVRFVTLTNGDAGHHEMGGVELARRRRQEADAVSRLAGVEYQIHDIHDGELEPRLEYRKQVVRGLRQYRPDLVLTHRPNDYHPDHRYTSILVQDASYLVTVPNVCTDTPILDAMPVIGYLSDSFRKPQPFQADVVVDIDAVMERKLDMLDCHVSQMYEWLPFNAGCLGDVPQGAAERREWLRQRESSSRQIAADCRDLLVQRYGTERGQAVEFAEAFEVSEYGARMDRAAEKRLFPF
jgi:N-acetylglucosamine malate deacetylase 1